MTFIVVTMTSWSPDSGYQKWYEIQPQYDEHQIFINMEHINDKHR